MTVFSADWLTLRESYDNAARNRAVLDTVVAAMDGRYAITVADLACGTGSTFRAISPFLTGQQIWRLYDNDISLLARRHPAEDGQNIRRFTVDLAYDLEVALDGTLDLVATSALLDLTSAAWIDRLATECAVRGLPFYAALSYDGQVSLTPAHPLDSQIVMAVNRHQSFDKGFGPALGPGAVSFAVTRFQAFEYAVTSGRSDWTFAPADRDMQTQILEGWASAAQSARGGLKRAQINQWLADRREHVANGNSSMRVGHIDFFARPITTR